MPSLPRKLSVALATVATFALIPVPDARGQAREAFPPGSLADLSELPPGRLRDQLQKLPPAAQARAKAWLREFHFTRHDVHSMHTDASGGICFACQFHPPHGETIDAGASEPTPSGEPVVGQAAVPVAPFPDHLKFSSRPGATNVIYINFSGQLVEGTEWNNVVARTSIPALPFTTDSDPTTFSDAEQLAIKRIWQRMAEDYAPFEVNVTTAPPATITNRTAVALITSKVDANGAPNPFNNAGGVAYVNVFGRSDFTSRYSPAWIYHNNLGNNESFIAEAASHEIGHNLGLSHDGLSTGAEYYGGHGSGEISWGPIMGTGYNRNVSQWSKGEYYNANNTQDDLAVIAGKLAYRPDDHGNTPGTATTLVITGGNQVASTNFENDPGNTNPDNKGILERNTDVDVFSLVHGDGPLNLNANPWVMPAGTRGGNLDLLLELRDENGSLIASNNPGDKTGATISTTLTHGRYFLHVRNSGAGNPLSSPPTGYTSYGSIGTYHLSGTITPADNFNPPPLAQLQATDLTTVGLSSQTLTVTYSDDLAINTGTIDSADLRVTGPGGFSQLATFVSVNDNTNGSPRVATYSLPPPSGSIWTAIHNGTYQVAIEENQVADTQGAFVATGPLGEFQVALPVPIYSANMDANPGWTLQTGTGQDPGWQYGTPNYRGRANAPTAGFTGSKVIAYNLSDDYPARLTTPRYATTAPIDVSSASNLTLQFRRWLRLTNQATGTIEVSTNGTSWTPIWSGSGVTDSSWQLLQYALPTAVEGSPSLRIRWGLSSGQRPQTDIGWNLDDVLILGDGALDTDPPTATLNVGDVTLSGSPSHSCSVTYSDATAVRLASLDALDLVVAGPGGYTTFSVDADGVETSTLGFIGADSAIDGSPLTASYDIPAPDGSAWTAADNGTYTVTLRAGSVEDTLNNTAPESPLGTFEVAISQAAPAELLITPAAGFDAAGDEGGPFSPDSIIFTLENTGGEALAWTASKGAAWLDLSAAGGTINPGASVAVTATLNGQADTLATGDYADLISFINTTSGIGNSSREISLSVSAAAPPARFSSYSVRADGVFELIISGRPGDLLRVDWSENLVNWNLLTTGEIGPEGTLILDDPASSQLPRRFYRLVTP